MDGKLIENKEARPNLWVVGALLTASGIVVGFIAVMILRLTNESIFGVAAAGGVFAVAVMLLGAFIYPNLFLKTSQATAAMAEGENLLVEVKSKRG